MVKKCSSGYGSFSTSVKSDASPIAFLPSSANVAIPKYGIMERSAPPKRDELFSMRANAGDILSTAVNAVFTAKSGTFKNLTAFITYSINNQR